MTQRGNAKQTALTYLPSGVDDLGRIFLSFILDVLAEGILDCRIIALNKVAVHKLNSKGGFALFCRLAHWKINEQGESSEY